MAQRILIAACLVMVAACCAMVGIVWNEATRSTSQATEANRQLAEVLSQTQATNQEMIKQLQVMARPAPAPMPGEWIPVSFKLTTETPAGPPAAGYDVVLGPGYGGASGNDARRRRSDAAGLADFGVVHPGDWEFTIKSGSWQARGSLNAVPGTPVVQSIICPKLPRDLAKVRIRIAWPAHLADKNFQAAAYFERSDLTYQAPLRWKTEDSVEILCGPNGEASIPDYFVQLEWSGSGQSAGGYVIAPAPYMGDGLIGQGRIQAHVETYSSVLDKEPLELVASRYSLKQLMVLRPKSRNEKEHGQQFELLALLNRKDQGTPVRCVDRSGSPTGLPTLGYDFSLRGVRIRSSSLDPFDQFEAHAGQTNEWVISLPGEMIKEVEKRLAADAPPRNAG